MSGFLFGSRLVVGFFGSRGLPSSASPGGLVARVVSSVQRASRAVAVGCSSGADAAVLSFRLSRPFLSSSSGPQLAVFAVGGPGGQGFWRRSAVALVRQAAALARSPGHGQAAPVLVCWWAGGQRSVPLGSRLAARTRALVSSVSHGPPGSALVGFVAGGSSVSYGSWLAVGLALAAGLPVVVFPVGCSVSCFPDSFSPLRAWGLGPCLPVSWVPAASSGVWALGFRAVVAEAPVG